MVMGVDPKSWPNLYGQLEGAGALDVAREISTEVRASGHRVTALATRRDRLHSMVDRSLKDIEEVSHTQRIAGRCRYT